MYIYILKVQKPSRKCLYVGATNDIERRYSQHLMGIGCKWAKRYFMGARKELMYVERVSGKEWKEREQVVKNMRPMYKEKLIKSDSNILLDYDVQSGLYNVKVKVRLKDELPPNQ